MFKNKNFLSAVLIVFVAFVAFLFAKPDFKNKRSVSSDKDESADFCQREEVGGEIVPPPDLFAKDGVLQVHFSYESLQLEDETRYCYMFNGHGGKRRQSPTLHVWPGERIRITVTNNTMAPISTAQVGESTAIKLPIAKPCKADVLTPTSMNVHFHGTNTAPACGADDVIGTVINAKDSFTYDLLIPKDEPPGLYFYHPHIHGSAEAAAWGGATGAIIVEGLQNYFPHDKLSGLNERVFIIRDSEGPKDEELSTMGVIEEDKEKIPAFHVSLNYHPIPISKYTPGKHPEYTPPKLTVLPNQRELWRVVNSSADAIMDIEVVYDGKDQPMTIYAIDAVPTNSHFSEAKPIVRNHWTLAPGNRVEFTVKTPGPEVKQAQLVTEKFDTGADSDPARPLANIIVDERAQASKLKVGAITGDRTQHRFTGIMRRIKSNLFGQKRKMYFAKREDPKHPEIPTEFYLTVDDGKHKDEAFKLNRPIDITTHQEALEEWTIENRDEEAHVFHIHQIHFLLIGKNGKHLFDGDEERQTYDTIVVPKWEGEGHPYPSVTLRMDFHETPPGLFVYHCHILEHEDKGMMGLIKVLPHK